MCILQKLQMILSLILLYGVYLRLFYTLHSVMKLQISDLLLLSLLESDNEIIFLIELDSLNRLVPFQLYDLVFSTFLVCSLFVRIYLEKQICHIVFYITLPFGATLEKGICEVHFSVFQQPEVAVLSF